MIPNSLFINDVVVSADEIVLNEPYNIWFAPEHSFGTDSMKEVNWSFFQGFFQDHFYKNCMYKRYSYSSWTNGNQYVSIGKSWNDSGFWKLWINLSVPVNLFEVNVSFGCDREVLSFFEKDNYELWFNYSVPNSGGEVYCVMLNYSDIAGVSGVTFSKHCENNVCWVSIHRNNILSGFYSFDPTFGSSSLTALVKYIVYDGSPRHYANWNMTTSSGTADNITFYYYGHELMDVGDSVVIGCCLYESLDTSVNFAGNSVGNTSNITITTATSTGWKTLDFLNPKPVLVANTYYYISIFIISETLDNPEDLKILRNNGGWIATESALGPESPWVGETNASNCMVIYCSYTESAGGWSNTAPSISCQSPANASTGIAQHPTVSVCVNDTDGNATTVCFYENSSGSWVLSQVNNSVSANSTVYWNYANALGYGNRFWWNVTAMDETVNVSSWNYFTTLNNPWSNNCSIVSNVGFANHSVDVCLKPTMNVTVTDTDGNTSIVSWLSNISGSWTTYQVNTSVLNTTVYWNYSQANTGSTRYYWNITVEDLGGCNNSFNYYFDTIVNVTPPVDVNYSFSVGNPVPANGSYNNPLTGSWCIQINNSAGELFSWNISIVGVGFSSDTGSSNGTKCYAYSLLVCHTNYTVYVNLSLPRGNWTNYSFWFWTIDCVYCPSSSFNYSNLSIILYFDLFSQNGSFNFTIETNSSLRISQTWAVNGTYSIILYNITLGANYTVWVNQTVLNSSNIGCYYNKTYYYEVYNGSSSGVDNMDVTIYLNAETIGIILFFIMMILSYKWESSVFCYFVSIMALVMGIYFIGFYFAMFGTLLGIIFILLSPYFAFLGYHFGYSKGGIGK